MTTSRDQGSKTVLYLLVFCRIVLGLVLLLAFANKVLNMPRFQQTVAGFGILPPRLSAIAAVLFVAGELVVVLLMALGGAFLGPGFALATLLLVSFSVALLSVLVRGMNVSCGCFGPSQKAVSAYDLWRNAGFILCALAGLGALTAQRAGGDLSLAELAIVAATAAVFVTIWLNLRDIVQLLRLS